MWGDLPPLFPKIWGGVGGKLLNWRNPPSLALDTTLHTDGFRTWVQIFGKAIRLTIVGFCTHFNPCHAEVIWGSMQSYLHLLSFLTISINRFRQLKYAIKGDKDLFDRHQHLPQNKAYIQASTPLPLPKRLYPSLRKNHLPFCWLLKKKNPPLSKVKSMILRSNIFKANEIFFTGFMFCWWRHNRLAMMSQWPDNCDANTWQVISNSLDIDFIHCDIHGRSWKKKC